VQTDGNKRRDKENTLFCPVGLYDEMRALTIGATGTISKTIKKYVTNILGNHEVKELQKTDILGTAHILRRLVM